MLGTWISAALEGSSIGLNPLKYRFASLYGGSLCVCVSMYVGVYHVNMVTYVCVAKDKVFCLFPSSVFCFGLGSFVIK